MQSCPAASHWFLNPDGSLARFSRSGSLRRGGAHAAGVGCVYAGRLGFAAAAPARRRGAQVFTYRELERATDGFSEGNVVGRGASGDVFRGRLADGTPAAIKRLRLDQRRQGEREFRIEVRPPKQPHPAHTHVAVASRHRPCAPVHVHVRRAPLRVRRTKPYLLGGRALPSWSRAAGWFELLILRLVPAVPAWARPLERTGAGT